MNKLEWTRRALKQRQNIDQRYRQKINQQVAKLAFFPDITIGLDIKKLAGTNNQYCLRVRFYRIIYSVENKVPIIIRLEKIVKRDNRTY